MADITLFELHIDDASFSNSAPFFGDGEGEPSGDTDGSGGAVGKLVVLLALGAVAALAWLVLRNGVDEGIELPN
ncbi:MAG: hypothetical protein ABEJ94_08785 [Halorientalis sp.]